MLLAIISQIITDNFNRIDLSFLTNTKSKNVIRQIFNERNNYYLSLDKKLPIIKLVKLLYDTADITM